jgi:hypothetical protein
MQDNIINEFNTVSFEELQRLGSMISLEGMSSESFMVESKARFNQFFARTDSFIKQIKFQVLGLGRMNGAALTAAINKVGYVNASTKDVIVPPGFTGHWLPYANALEVAFKCSSKLEGLVGDYNNCLGQLVSDPSLLKAFSGIPYSGSNNVGVSDQMTYIGKEFFNLNTDAYKRPLGACLERVADVPDIYTALNNAIQMDKTHPATEVTKLITRSMELSKKLVPQMDSDSEVSKAVREQLINLTLNIAKEIESYSVALYRMRQFSLAMEDSLKELNK